MTTPVSERTRIQICGRLSVERDGVQLAGALRGRQVPLLLAYLVLNRGRAVGREELIGALWPSSAPVSQDAALRTLLSRLRSALGTGAVAGRDEITLELPPPVWIDYEAAARELERAQTALGRGDPRGAWALAQIPFNIARRGLLPGAQSDWLEPFRRELEGVRLAALAVIGRAGLDLGPGQTASAERAARALVAADRFSETGYGLLMEALAARGDVAQALRVFEELRTLLREELGMVPSADVLAVHERLLHAGRRSRGPDLPPEGQGGAGHPAPLPAELALRARGRLVGRASELAELSRRWAAAEEGIDPADPDSARLVLLTGEPGIGKSRLLAELARQAHDGGGIVLHGRAPDETGTPYQPFLEALRHWVVNAAEAALSATLREYGAELARLMPELRRRLFELPPTDAEAPETERYRLFEAVVGLMVEITKDAPILLVLDDLQWADRPSRLLLRHLTRAARPDRLLLVAAYRTTEAASDELSTELAALRRDRLVAEVPVGGLTAVETAELVREAMGGSASGVFVEALHEETAGNPFFIEEIVRSLAEQGVTPAEATATELSRALVPEGVRQVIMGRLDRLSPDAFECLRAASVIGRDFEAGLLEEILGRDEETFLAGLDAGLSAGLIHETGPEHYLFSHALVQETLYAGMSSARRSRLHRRVAHALESRGGAKLTPLALHFARAADVHEAEKAIDYARRAAEEAAAMLAHEEAAAHLGRALEVVERYAPEDLEQRCELMLLLAEAHVRTGERKLATPAFRQAALLAERLGDAEALARAAIGASRRYIQQPGVVDEELIAMIERALELLGPQPRPLRARLLGRLCGAIYYAEGRARMAELAAEAAQIAETLGDPGSRAYAAAARRRALWEPSQLAGRLQASTEMLASAGQAGNPELTLQAHAWLVVDLLESGDLPGVDAQIAAFSQTAERVRQPLYAWNAIVWRAMREHLDGRLETAAGLAAEALAAGTPGEGVTAPQYHAIQLFAVRREQARFAELEPAADAFVNRNPDRPAWRAALAALLLETGRPKAAREQFELVAADGFAAVPFDLDWLVTVTTLADVAVGLGDGERAGILYEMLAPYARSHVVVGLAVVCLGSAERFLGKLAATRGELVVARGHLERAVAANHALPAPVALAHTRLDLAEILERGSRAEHARATELREQAQAQAEELDLGAVRARLAR